MEASIPTCIECRPDRSLASSPQERSLDVAAVSSLSEIPWLDLGALDRLARHDARAEPQVRDVDVEGRAPQGLLRGIAWIRTNGIARHVGAAGAIHAGDGVAPPDEGEQRRQIVELPGDDLDHPALALDCPRTPIIDSPSTTCLCCPNRLGVADLTNPMWRQTVVEPSYRLGPTLGRARQTASVTCSGVAALGSAFLRVRFPRFETKSGLSTIGPALLVIRPQCDHARTSDLDEGRRSRRPSEMTGKSHFTPFRTRLRGFSGA